LDVAFRALKRLGEVAAVYGLDPRELARSLSEILRPGKRT
jgi:hypothetical protein